MSDDTQIVIATHNRHKLAEIVPMFSSSNWTPILADDISVVVPEVDETGTTFADNALLKAQAFQAATQLPVVADDTGLEVTALDGAPGVHSNRWHPGTYEDRNIALLKRLAGVTNRSAQFTTVACLLLPNQKPQFFTGTVHGAIADNPRGSEGFGYDPLFIPEGYEQTFAELGSSVKEQLSHRARAFKQVVTYLQTI